MSDEFKLFKAVSKGKLPVNEEILHEPFDDLSDKAKDITRIVHSMIEELEAIGVYNQRMEGTKDTELRDILEHNRNEEIDHAMKLLEKFRKVMPEVEERMKKYLFQKGNENKD